MTIGRTETRTIGMKITLGPDAKAEEAIREFRWRAAEQGFEWEDGTESAHMHEYVTRKTERLEAVDVRGLLFPTVYAYEKRPWTQITGTVWTVTARTVEVVEPYEPIPIPASLRSDRGNAGENSDPETAI